MNDTNFIVLSGRIASEPKLIEKEKSTVLHISITSICNVIHTESKPMMCDITVELTGERAKYYSTHGTLPLKINDVILVDGNLDIENKEVYIRRVNSFSLIPGANPPRPIN